MPNWLADSSFSNIVRQAWMRPGDWRNKVSEFKRIAKIWNRENFGNIFHKKSKILARLEGIDKSLMVRSNHRMEMLQKDLWRELEEILNQEELFWYQRASQVFPLGYSY